MRSYAQTNIQLFNQLRREGYSSTDLNLIRDAYELAMASYSCRFSPSGRPFISHVVRTASILASFNLPVKVVAAGLLHNVYGTGDFGNGAGRISNANRQKISRALGHEVEEYISRFPSSYWGSPTIQLARSNPDQLPPIDRDLVLILLADHLEHLLDLDALYYVTAERRYYLENSRIAAEIAERLRMIALAAELKDAVREAESAEVPVELRADRIRDRSFVIVPRSCRKRFSVTMRSLLAGSTRTLKIEIQKLRFLCAKLAKPVKQTS